MQERGRSRVVVWIVIGVVVVALIAFGISYSVGSSARRERLDQKQVQAEEDRLEGLELKKRLDEGLGKSLTPQETEELRQLRERAAKRKIDRGY